MSMPVLDLVLHPVRMRIINAMAGGATMTTSQLRERLPEIPQATLYRHVATLVAGALLEIEGEQQVGGALERRYRLVQERVRVTDAMARAMTIDEHRHGFATAMATMISEFNAYLAQRGADPFADSVAYRQSAVWLSDAECADLVAEVTASLMKRLRNAPSPERRAYLASTILFPTEPRPRKARTPRKRR